MTLRLWRAVWLSFGVLGAAAALPAQGDDEYSAMLVEARAKLDRGELSAAESRLEELFAAFEEEAPADKPPVALVEAARLVQAEILARRGDYELAAGTIERLSADVQKQREAVMLRARLYRTVGRYEDAGKLLGDTLAAAADVEVRYELGDVRWRQGRRQEARGLWQQNTTSKPGKDARQLAFLGRSLWRLGGRANLEAASQALVDALGIEPDNAVALTTFGVLKFEAYGETANFPSGEKDLQKVLDRHGDLEEALLAMYRIRSMNSWLDAGKTDQFLERALTQNPRSVDAIVLRGANLVDDRHFEEAAQRLDQALAIDQGDKQALAHRAAAAYLLHDQDGYRRFRERALAGDPGQPDVDVVMGDHLASLYRFADAVPFYAAALATAPGDIDALKGMAKVQIYTGDGEGARINLERAKQEAKGLVDAWRNNALAAQQLLDEEYVVVRGGPFEFRMHRDDAEVLGTYFLPIALEAAETLGAKYGLRPEGTVHVDVLHTWDDFSVRTTGFRGFSALGACFGKFITIVSPGDGDVRRQDFMWEATVWHEYVHVLTLGLSNNRVPRWLTEGFSVYEEKVRDRTWERGMDRDLFDAFHNNDIAPLHLLNRLFRGSRILFGYYQGGLVVEWIAEKKGFPAAIELLRAFGDDLDLEAACRRALGMGSRELDRALLDWIEKTKLRGMKLVPRFDERAVQELTLRAGRDRTDLDARVALAWAFQQRQNPVDAGRWLAEALRIDAANGDALLVRAAMLAARKDSDGALAAWKAGFAAGAEDFDSRIAYGDALLADGDEKGAEDQYQRAKACWPACTEQESAPELRLAKLYRDQGDRTRAQMEMKTYCQRTARAFTPRMTLAEFMREAGDRGEEVRYLTECNRIDPFHRPLHVQLGEALLALDKKALAAREFEMAAAVTPKMDRRYQRKGAEAPAADAPEELGERGELWIRAARLRHELGDDEKAKALVARVLRDAAGTPAAADASALQQEWEGR